MLKIILYSVILLITSVFYAQTKKGEIKDIKTGKPIAYASLQINKNQGTISNEEGKFSLNSTNFKETDSVKVSFLGYKTQTFTLKDLPNIILLEDDIVDLEAVNLNEERLTVQEIIQKAKENYATNYDNLKHLKQRIFVRNTTISNIKKFKMEIDRAKNYDKKTIKKLNLIIDSIRKPMLSNKGIEYRDLLFDYFHKNKDTAKVRLIKATQLSNPETNFSMEAIGNKLKKGFKKLFKDKVFKVKVLFFKVEDSLKTEEIVKEEKMVLYPGQLAGQMQGFYKNGIYNDNQLIQEILNPKYYDYKITNNVFYNNEFVYEISYKPRRSKAKYTGKLYVSDESFAILKLDFNMLPDKKIAGTSLKWLGVAYKVYGWKGSMEFYQNEKGKYVPKYIRQSKKMYNYSKIPLRFIENTKAKHKLKFKLKSQFETVATFNSEFLFLKNEPLNLKEYNSIKMKKEFPLEKLTKYQPKIWKQYNIIAPTKDLLDYHTNM